MYQIEKFTQEPKCSSELVYSLLDESGDELADPAMKIELIMDDSLPSILIETEDKAYIGAYKVFL